MRGGENAWGKGGGEAFGNKKPRLFQKRGRKGRGVRCEGGGYRESCGSREGFPSPILRPSR